MRKRTQHTTGARRWVASAVLSGLLAAAALVAAPATGNASHGNFTASGGIYRIPYADGTTLDVWQDHHTHGGDNCCKDRTDLSAGKGSSIVAAAGGWIRYIRDHNGDTFGRGDDLAHDATTAQDDALEHGCSNNNPADPAVDPPNPIFGSCAQYNNYVWIEHPNGEWTKYTHFGTGTVTTEAGRQVDDWVDAGDFLGLEDDIGAARGNPADHLHYEVAVPNDPAAPTLPLTSEKTGFVDLNQAQNLVPRTCDGDGNVFFYDVANDGLTANPCDHAPPTADAGGPYVVAEGSTVQLDGAGSDPDGLPLSYLWATDVNLDDPAPANLDDPTLAQPTYTGVDDGVETLVLNVYDTVEAIGASDDTTVTVLNVAPTVVATAAGAGEGENAALSATITDPGTQDTHTAEIDWGDGTSSEGISAAQLAGGASHVYGDNSTFQITVTVTDDDGGVGVDTVDMPIGNIDPTVSLDDSGAVAFPGGDYLVVEQGEQLPASAEGTDPGTDDLTFAWSTGQATTYFNNGNSPDPFPSPSGTRPFLASDDIDAVFGVPGAETLGVALTDDDGGSDSAEAGVVVTGTAQTTQGSGWWKHQFSDSGSPHIDPDTAAGYLDVVNAVSHLFSEFTPAQTAAEAHDVLSPTGDDRRARARAELLMAWLHFASGAVSWDATVPLSDGTSVAFLDLMAAAEVGIIDGATSDAELLAIEHDLARVRHAS